MNRIATPVLVLALTAITETGTQSQAQGTSSDCGVTVATAPAIRGMRLGMTVDQFVSLFPGSTKRRDFKESLDKAKDAKLDEPVTLTFQPGIDATGSTFADVDSVAAVFYKGRAGDITIQYVGQTWKSIDEWVDTLVPALGLPARTWTPGESETPNKVLKCKGVEFEAAIQGGGSSIRIHDTSVPSTRSQSQGGTERRRAFKP